jgi:hypothetical protein
MSKQNRMDYITISSTGNASDFGDATVSRRSGGACSNGSRGVCAGGEPSQSIDEIDYWTFASLGNAIDFGDLSTQKNYTESFCSDGTKGVVMGGGDLPGPASTETDVIEYINIASTGDVTDFGDLTVARHHAGAASNGTRMVAAGGQESP